MQTILILDDDPDTRELLLQYCDFAQVKGISAADGEAALALALAEAPVLALVDLRLPGMDGLEFTRRLRVLQVPRVTWVVILTAMPVTDVDTILSAGADAVSQKPIGIQAFNELIRSLL